MKVYDVAYEQYCNGKFVAEITLGTFATREDAEKAAGPRDQVFGREMYDHEYVDENGYVADDL